VEQAIHALESRRSVSARIRQRVDLFGHKPVGSGTYFEQRVENEPYPRFRLSLRVRLGEQSSTLLQICDGRRSWTYGELDGSETLSRIDVDRVQRVLEEKGDAGRLSVMGKWPGLGGLPRLLRGLHANFKFTPVGQTRLSDQLTAWTLRGEWNREMLTKLLPGQKEAIDQGKPPDWSRLPEHLADHVVLYLGTADRFPYRIEYRRRDPDRKEGPSGPQSKAIGTLEFRQVDLAASIPPGRFDYQPGDVEWTDQTDRFLEDLGLGP
jgi:hypothetical protein